MSEPKIKPESRRCRLMTTYEGKFIHVGDFAKALKDDEFVKHCAMMLVVAKQLKAPPIEGLRRAIGCAVMILAGNEAWAHKKRMEAERR